jgi:plasmid replication initiation protein
MAKKKSPRQQQGKKPSLPVPAAQSSSQVQAKKSEPQVRKSNVFIDGRYRFNLQEQKILLQIISKVRMDEKEFSSYFVSWSDLKEISKNNLDSVKKIDASCEKLKNKTIKIRKENTEENFGFLSGWRTVAGQGVHFRIDPGMKEMLLDLLDDGNFTLFSLECAMSLTSAHSIRLYEVLKSQQWKKQPVVLSLDRIKHSLDIDSGNPSYADFGNFRTQILEKAQKAFKEHTDIIFAWVPIKEGRKVVSLEITVKDNPKYQRTVQAAAVTEETKGLQAGDIIIMNGNEYEFTGSGLITPSGAIPTGQLLQLIKQGKAVKI